MYAHVCVGIPFNVYTHFISFHLVSFHYLTLPYPTLHYTTHIFAQTVLSNCDVERIGCAKKRFRYSTLVRPESWKLQRWKAIIDVSKRK